MKWCGRLKRCHSDMHGGFIIRAKLRLGVITLGMIEARKAHNVDANMGCFNHTEKE